VLYSTVVVWLPTVLGVASAMFLVYLYYEKRAPRWRSIINRAAEYHRFHLVNIRNENGINEPSRDLAYAMLMITDRQFRDDMKGSPGLYGVVRAHLGEKSTLSSLNEVFMKLYRDRAFLGNSDIDERLERLFFTMISMVYRFYMMTSICAIPALMYMDIVLALTIIHWDNRGSSRLFRDLAMNQA
jgi:hypothetical protein